MTQPAADPMNVAAREVRTGVRNALLAGGVKIGTARLPNGTMVEALVMGDFPEGTTASGLEIQISEEPELTPMGGFEHLGFQRVWTVRVIDWKSGDHETDQLEQAANALVAVYHPFESGPDILPASPDYPEQMVIGIIADQLG